MKKAKKKSYYIPVKKKKKVAKKTAKKKVAKKVAKKKYKSYHKPKTKKSIFEELDLPVPAPIPVSAEELKPYGITVEAPVKSKRPVKYLNNRDLLAQVILSKKNEKMSDELAKMLMLLTSRYAKKGNFANYTYNDDFQSYAMLMLVKTWKSFDPAKSSNPFAFFTQCIKNSFIQYLNQEKRQRDIKDEVLIDKGMNPSFGYAYDYEEKQASSEAADHETVEAPTKLHEDVDTFHSEPDSVEEDSAIPESY
jgi:hypothetical protein